MFQLNTLWILRDFYLKNDEVWGTSGKLWMSFIDLVVNIGFFAKKWADFVIPLNAWMNFPATTSSCWRSHMRFCHVAFHVVNQMIIIKNSEYLVRGRQCKVAWKKSPGKTIRDNKNDVGNLWHMYMHMGQGRMMGKFAKSLLWSVLNFDKFSVPLPNYTSL